MEFELRSYGKSELAMLYFPKSSPDIAMKRLNRWINNIKELKYNLASCHIGKNAKYCLSHHVLLRGTLKPNFPNHPVPPS